MTGIDRRTFAKAGAAVAAAALSPAAVALPAAARPRYRDPSAPIPERVADLLARMTVAEKAAQLMAVSNKPVIQDAAGTFDPAKARAAFPDGIGHIASPSLSGLGRPGVDPTRTAGETARFMNAVQAWAAATRLGIPVLAHEESLHGLARRDATSFPQAIGLASSFDPDLLTRVFASAAAETRLRGVHLVLTPVVDVARDPRWGRTEETYGEDTFLCATMGVAAIRGFQGDLSRGLAPDRVLATVKHFAGHGGSEGGENAAPLVTGGERTFREQLLPPYRAAVEQGHAAAVMPTYHEVDGVPMCANHRLLTDVLRGEWGFAGITVSDYEGIRQLRTIHHVAATDADAAALAILAGVDVEFPDPQTYVHLPALVAAGRVPMARLDEAVGRVLTLKFASGLFDRPMVDVGRADRLTGTAAGRALAREAAGRTMILLKNDHATLPFDPARVGRLAVLGISASDTPIGGYSDKPRHVVSVVEALQAEAASGRFQVDYAVGVRLTRTRVWEENEVIPPTPAEAKALRDEALAVAARADRVLLVLGDNEETSREAWSAEHLGDRAHLDLWGEQEALAEAVLALGKPVVVLLLNGRPPAIPFIAEHADAILEGWYLGQETGNAVADVLFGRVNPGGKLPISIPRSEGQLPSYYSVKPSARRGYLDSPTTPLWAFGHGLSYTRFDVSAPRLPAGVRAGAAVTVEVDVTNTGDRAGDEVVQVYLHPAVSPVTEPARALKGFRRVTLAAGERRTVAVTLEPRAFAIVGLDMKEAVLPGAWVVEAGPGLDRLKTATLTLSA